MYGPPMVSGQLTATQILPAKVSAAQTFLQFMENCRIGPMIGGSLPGDSPKDNSRELSQKEQVVYNAALEVLRTYFTGENDFMPAVQTMVPMRPEDPENPSPVMP